MKLQIRYLLVMTLNDNELMKLIKTNDDKKIILYGAASRGIRVFYNLIQKGINKNQILFCSILMF